MKNLSEAQKYIDSFPRPSGYNQYAWNVTKKVALEVWDCYLNNKRLHRPINYFCQEFYSMIKTPDGQSIVPAASYFTC